MNIVANLFLSISLHYFQQIPASLKFTQCSPKVSPGDAIFCSILAANIAYYGSLPKTLNLTPPELM
jgi:hypothetical protein